MRTLQAGGFYQEALAAAEANLGPLANDKTVLLYLTRLAQAANRPDAAERYVKQLLQLSMARALSPLAAARAGQGGVVAVSMQDFRQSLQQ
ncbi:hypothetical protein ABTH15_19405, partial [Acinetobacter baumannii]